MGEALWTQQDFEDGICHRSHIGSPRRGMDSGGGVEPRTTVLPLEMVTPEKVRADARTAYERRGNVVFLKAPENKKFFHQMLEQVILESPPAQVVRLVGMREAAA
jgi:hypothetical protein